jgi:hypothetical protein
MADKGVANIASDVKAPLNVPLIGMVTLGVFRMNLVASACASPRASTSPDEACSSNPSPVALGPSCIRSGFGGVAASCDEARNSFSPAGADGDRARSGDCSGVIKQGTAGKSLHRQTWGLINGRLREPLPRRIKPDHRPLGHRNGPVDRIKRLADGLRIGGRGGFKMRNQQPFENDPVHELIKEILQADELGCGQLFRAGCINCRPSLMGWNNSTL